MKALDELYFIDKEMKMVHLIVWVD